MKCLYASVLLTLSVFAAPASIAQVSTPPPATSGADLVIWGGSIYTAEDSRPTVEAVAVSGGRFTHVGSRLGAEALVGADTRVIDLSGAALFPGFTDAHAHLSGVGARELSLSLDAAPSLSAVLEKVAQWALDNPNGPVIGRGWIETQWPEGRMPTRWDLDDLMPDRVVILGRADGHALVVNSAALSAAGIDTNTPNPEGGRIERNALGEATGILVDNAKSLVASLFPPMTTERRDAQLKAGSAVTAAKGWVGMHNMSVPWVDVERLEALDAEGKIGIRVYNAVDVDDADRLFASGPRTSQSGRIETRTIKLYVDGALGSRGAALLAPYADAETNGLMLTSKDKALPVFEAALRDGIQIAAHAIGDRANRLLLDWYETAFEAVPSSERGVPIPRWRVEHAQIISPADIPRFTMLGIIPSMQPSHAIGDLYFAPDRLGEDRLDGAYAWRDLLDTGSIIAGGTDAPVEIGDPLIEFYAASQRRSIDGFQGPNWRGEQAVSREEALKMFTLWPAVAAFAEGERGSIAVGKAADMTVVDQDIMVIEPAAILQSKVIYTIVEGSIIFARDP